jgi:hypothetical protein
VVCSQLMADERQRLREWSTLIPHAASERQRYLEELVELLEVEDIGEVERLSARRGTPELVRVTRRDMEADTTAQAMGRHLHVGWALYYHPSWLDRHMPPILVGEVTNDAEIADVKAFATVALSAAYNVAVDLALELGQEPPQNMEASGVIGPAD